jgi:hypothetical protein
MHRTTVMMPQELKRQAAQRARLQNMSLGECVRRALEAAVRQNGKTRRGEDPLLRDGAVFKGGAPRDWSARHDVSLYGKRHFR